MKKNFKKTILSLLLLTSAFIFVPSNSVFAETISKDVEYSEELQEYFEMFPQLKQQFDEAGITEVVGESNIYFKVVPNTTESDIKTFSTRNIDIQTSSYNDEDKSTDDFSFIPISKEEFQEQKIIEDLRSQGISTLNTWGDSNNSGYVNINLSVSQTVYNQYHRYFVNVCFNWIRKAKMATTDGFGFKLSSNMVVLKDTVKCESIGFDEYNRANPSPLQKVLKHDSEHGVGAEIVPFPMLNGVNGYLNSYVIFTTVNRDEKHAVVNGYYLSNHLTVGGLSIDATGTPSLGIGTGVDKFPVGVNISYTPN